MKRIRLSEGIALNILRSDKFKTEYFDWNILLPLREETASFAALLPQVLSRGSARYPSMRELTKRRDFLYSTEISSRVIKRGETQILGFTADFLRDEFIPDGTSLIGEVFDLLRETVLNPLVCDGSFRADYVESEKKNLIDAIRSLINNKNLYAKTQCLRAMCADSAFAVSEIGSEERVNEIDGKTLYAFYRNLFKTAAMELYYVGNAREETIVEKATALVAGIERNYVPLPKTVPFVRTRTDVQTLTEEMDVVQGKLCIGFSTNHTIRDNDYTAFMLFNELYGGSPTAKLFENVREKLSLCYYCSSAPEAHKGILTVSAGIENENRDKALAEIFEQLRLTANGQISEEELSSAKKSLIQSYRRLDDDNAGLALWYLSRRIAESEKTPDDIIREIDSVTVEQIAACAADVKADTVFFLKGAQANGQSEESKENGGDEA